MDQVLFRLPALVQVGKTQTWKGLCPFHTSKVASLLVNFEIDSASCPVCYYGGGVKTFLNDMDLSDEGGPATVGRILSQVSPVMAPNDSYGHLLNEEVSGIIYRHVFLAKLKGLAAAVERLQDLISRMNLR